jgi:hypothetical protein
MKNRYEDMGEMYCEQGIYKLFYKFFCQFKCNKDRYPGINLLIINEIGKISHA